MNSSEIFTLALGLAEPWYVSKVELIEGEQSKKELHLWLSLLEDIVSRLVRKSTRPMTLSIKLGVI